MKELHLPHGHVALVDDEDYAQVCGFTWYVVNKGYVARGEWSKNVQRLVLLHRQLLQPPTGVEVDHRNHNKLDNRRANLRLSTTQENARNKLPLENKLYSAYKGVCYQRRNRRKWVAGICVNYKQIHLGSFATEREAALAYNAAALERFGEFALINAL